MEFVKKEEDMEIGISISQNVSAPIKLYTFHGAKGLEFPNVIIPHLNEGSVPYGKNLKDINFEVDTSSMITRIKPYAIYTDEA